MRNNPIEQLHQPSELLSAALDQVLYSDASSTDRILTKLLNSVRERLGMEVAFISEFTSGRRVFRYVESARGVDIVRVGGSDPLDESYCAKIVAAELPELMVNAQDNIVARTLAATQIIPVGAHLGVPLRLSNGVVFGTFCLFSRFEIAGLAESDLGFLRVFADVASVIIERGCEEEAAKKALHDQLRALVHNNKLEVLFQPIFNVQECKVVGYEALCRTKDRIMPTDILFQQAALLGLGTFLDAHIIAKSLEYLKRFSPGQYLSCNVTPDTACNPELIKLFADMPDLSQVVFEITEHDAVRDYSAIALVMAPLRQKGARLAVDDAGAGYASLRHILLLKPDIIKLDISLIRDINRDHEKQALASALAEFSLRCGYSLVAEGVETREELNCLQGLGIRLIQGYLVSKPYPFAYFATWEPPSTCSF